MIARASETLVIAAVMGGLAFSGCDWPTAGKTLRLRSGPVATLDPAEAQDWVSLREIGRVYETPLRYRRDGAQPVSGTRVLNVRALEPWLLERLPARDRSGRRWVLDFKKGLRFHSSRLFHGRDRRGAAGRGREISACDWVDSIRRHLSPGSRSPWKAYLSKRLRGADSVTCESPSRAVVELRISDPEFEYFLAHPAASVLPVREIDARGWDVRRRPVGSGAFRLDEIMPAGSGKRLRWRALDPSSAVSRIEVDLTSEGGSDWARLSEGGLDLIEFPQSMKSKLLAADGTLLPEVREKGIELVKVARSDLLLVGISSRHSILSKKRGLRLALGLSISREDLIEQIFGGRAVEAHGPLPPGLPGYRIDYRHRFQGADVERARDLLGSNGHGFGRGLPVFRFGCLPHPFEQAICEVIRRSWERVGFKIELLKMSAESRRVAIQSGEVDLWPITWVADLPGPASFLELFLGVSSGGDGLVEIPSMPVARGQLEGLLARIRVAGTRGVRQSAIDSAQDLISVESPAAFLLHRFQYWLVRKGIAGVGLEDFSWHDSDQVLIQEKQ